MAKVIIDNQEYDIPDGTKLASICEEAGITFNCNTGVCGACLVQVTEGSENLDELKEEELDLGLDKTKRLSCQCAIKSGTVKLK